MHDLTPRTPWRLLFCVGCLLTPAGRSALAADTPYDPAARSAATAGNGSPPAQAQRGVSEVWLPLASVFLPGLGQYVQGELVKGFAFSGVYVGGALVYLAHRDSLPDGDDLSRTTEAQLAEWGLQLTLFAGLMSSYDAYHRSMRVLQTRGRYDFAGAHQPSGQLLLAPSRFGYLKNLKTSLVLGGLAVAAGYVIANEERSAYRLHDAVYTTGISYNAGVGEEAFFRGYIYPYVHEHWGRRFWLSNSFQALLFGLAHLGSVDVPVAQTLFGFYQGYVTRHNDWDIRESIFQHFWWDVVVFTAALLTDENAPRATLHIELPPLRF